MCPDAASCCHDLRAYEDLLILSSSFEHPIIATKVHTRNTILMADYEVGIIERFLQRSNKERKWKTPRQWSDW
jgi:hypothetical protein